MNRIFIFCLVLYYVHKTVKENIVLKPALQRVLHYLCIMFSKVFEVRQFALDQRGGLMAYNPSLREDLCSVASVVADDSNETFNVNIYDNFFGLEHLFYGDLTKMDDMFLPSPESEASETNDVQDDEELLQSKAALFKLKEFDDLRPKVMTPDVVELNDVTKIVQNETRRYNGKWLGWADYEDFKYGWFKENPLFNEYIKKDKLSNMHLQWIVHTRIQIEKAFVLRRDDLRMHKQYKIGYLMSRLRIIRYEQQKIASYAISHEKDYCRGLKNLLKYYERMVRYDVDIKDTVNFIKEIDKKPNPMDIYITTRSTPLY